MTVITSSAASFGKWRVIREFLTRRSYTGDAFIGPARRHVGYLSPVPALSSQLYKARELHLRPLLHY